MRTAAVEDVTALAGSVAAVLFKTMPDAEPLAIADRSSVNAVVGLTAAAFGRITTSAITGTRR